MMPISQAVNPGRSLAYQTFCETLNDLIGKPKVSEKRFRDEWLAKLRGQPQLTTNGWYDPPPHGMGILFGSDTAAQGFSCSSLRSPERWPSDNVIDWPRGLMYAYCSPVHIPSGLPGDFGVTLYFGSQRRVLMHFAKALELANIVLTSITSNTTSRALFRFSQDTFRTANMRSNVASITDTVPVDLGHSLSRLPMELLSDGRQLTDTAIERVRRERLFISESADWPLCGAGQWTIEPSLIYPADPSLPQVSPHYVIDVSHERVVILRECDLLFEKFGLL